jgi:hypothetical protein
MMSRMAEKWATAAADLGLEIIAPFRLTLPDGRKLEFDVLLKNFGNTNGMLLTSDHDVFDYGKAIVGLWYGYSIMGQPDESEAYDRESIIEVLADWTWSGPDANKPDWLPEQPVDDDE